MYRWDRALYTDKVLSDKSRERMFTPFVKTPNGRYELRLWMDDRERGRPQSDPAWRRHQRIRDRDPTLSRSGRLYHCPVEHAIAALWPYRPTAERWEPACRMLEAATRDMGTKSFGIVVGRYNGAVLR